ncbi:MAG: hypothetical protein A3F72_05130 [Bacteroidetes bacterium RIFCSPLOWO2_12_FULL_35_15]|nr:MAG: hypothetical protein A3F72_05130 [Bacteroidetes bacterium RIFCSPLOWO2_12_FULL_35_15]
MKVLYISYDGMTDPLGQSQVIPYLIGLSQLGHQITIISCEKKDRFEKQNKFIVELLKSNNIAWHPVSYSKLPSVFAKQFNLNRINKKAFALYKEKKFELVHSRSYMAALIGLKLKQKYGIKFIFDMRGFWADERIDGGIWNLKNMIHKRIYNFFKKKEFEFLTNADYTVSLTQNAKEEILSWPSFQKKEIPIDVIPCCVDLKLFSEKSISHTKLNELQLVLKIEKNDLILSYLGSIGTWYMLDEMLDFFKLLSSKKSNAKFLFITPDDKNLILSKAQLKGISKEKLIIHSASRNEVPLYLSLSHISVYFIKPLYSKKASSPTKTGEIMGMGIPIITNSGIGDSDRIISDSKAGMIINDFSNKEYLRIIDQMDALLKTDKTMIKTAAENYFSLEKGVQLYADVYRKLEK